VPFAEFWEKEFETAFAIELAIDGGYVLSSSQVIEKIIGYDAAAHPAASNIIWQILNVPRPRAEPDVAQTISWFRRGSSYWIRSTGTVG